MTAPHSDDAAARGGTGEPPPKEPPEGISLDQLSPEALEKLLEEAKVSDQEGAWGSVLLDGMLGMKK
jgi:hypothetical protein